MISLNKYINEGLFGNLGMDNDIKTDWITRYNNQTLGDSPDKVGKSFGRAELMPDGSILLPYGIVITDPDLLTDEGTLPDWNFVVVKHLKWLVIACEKFKSFKGITGVDSIMNMRIFENSITDKGWMGMSKIVNLFIYNFPNTDFMKSILDNTKEIFILQFGVDWPKEAKQLMPVVSELNFHHVKTVILDGLEAKHIDPIDFVDAVIKNTTKLNKSFGINLTESPMDKFRPLKSKPIRGTVNLFITPNQRINTAAAAEEFVRDFDKGWLDMVSCITIKGGSALGITNSTMNSMTNYIKSQYGYNPVIFLQK